jgi:hypothetical protein
MTDPTAFDTPPNAVLEGGPGTGFPFGFPEAERVRHVPDLAAPVKVLRGNRWEQFRPTGRTVRHPTGDLHAFVWYGSTRVAE